MKQDVYKRQDEIRDGFSIKFLGEDMLFVVTECEKEKVYSEGKIIHICCQDANDQSKIQRQFENWWRKQAKALLQERTEHRYPIIEKYGIPMPKVSVRKMKTLWGSCSVNRGIITLNFYLIKAGIPYIDYVDVYKRQEVHRADCAWLPDAANRIYLGEFYTSQAAVQEARKYYNCVDGCEHCCPESHTR